VSPICHKFNLLLLTKQVYPSLIVIQSADEAECVNALNQSIKFGTEKFFDFRSTKWGFNFDLEFVAEI